MIYDQHFDEGKMIFVASENIQLLTFASDVNSNQIAGACSESK